jgi:hypothetical protein
MTQAVLVGFDVDDRGAVFSPCGRYRYRLWRATGAPRDRRDRRVLWVMLNPSTADADRDDATIRRVIGFSRRWGYWRLDVCNLFAWRATDPAELTTVADPVGPENDGHIVQACETAADVILAWGGCMPPRFGNRPLAVLRLLNRPLHCLGRTQAGQPAHPLRLPNDLDTMPWEQ